MARVQIAVEMKGVYSYEAPAYGYGYETRYIYTMLGEDGKTYVWKTTAFMTVDVPYTGKPGGHYWEDRKGNPVDKLPINKGDKIVIKATIKGEDEYNGQPQTELTRVVVVERTFKAKTPEEIEAERKAANEAKKQEQLDSICGGDFIWKMPYKQYKEHYSDCETVVDSFKPASDYGRIPATVEVIVREGRLKASGVRGKHYRGFMFSFVYNGKETRQTFRAVSEETALKQLNKYFKGATDVECVHIYQYFSA